MRQQFKVYLLALGFVLGVTLKALAEEPTFITIEVPGATSTTPSDINSSGEIVGRYVSADSSVHGFLRSRCGEFTSIDFPDANLTVARGINSHHDIVGAVRFPGEPTANRHGFLLRGGSFTTFDFPGSTITFAYGISPRGDIVGTYTIANVTHGYLLSRCGEFTSIDFPDARETRASKINPRGQIVGGYVTADGKTRNFLLSEGEFRTIDLPGDFAAFVEGGGINSRGDIVGAYCDTDTEPCIIGSLTHGFLLSRGVFTTIDVPGSIGGTGAGAINSQGEIVGLDVGSQVGFLREPGEDED